MESNETYIDVAVTLPSWQTYTYSVPIDMKPLVMIGKRVLVPFGNRRVTGYIINITDTSVSSGEYSVKPVEDILDESPLFHPSQFPFFTWISNYYLYPPGEVIKAALPGGLNTRDIIVASLTDAGLEKLETGEPTEPERRILTELTRGPRSTSALLKLTDPPMKQSVVGSLLRKNWIHQTRELKKETTSHKFETVIGPGRIGDTLDPLPPKKREIVSLVHQTGDIPLKELTQTFPTVSSHLKSLENDGWVIRSSRKTIRDPFGEPVSPDRPPVLTDEQASVLSSVETALGGGFSSYLLAGVTGSGKTEVYMQLIRKTLEKGLTALVLVPEISLISQTERRFRMRFGDGIAVLHSALSKGEKFDQWMRIAEKEVSIVIGARSAIFAPLENIGIIIVDEEHDTSYKQENGLRYNARDLAVVRAKLEGAVCLLGSATPSIQSYYNTSNGKFRELRLEKRVSDRPLPLIRVVDLKTYRDHPGIRSFITPPLEEAMAKTLHQREQVLLFLNRRGYANYPVCATCGEPMKCVSCDVSLTLHQSKNAYRCHMCNYIIPSVSKCRTCNSSNIKNLGFGTERIEAAVKALFPSASVARMDQDTTLHKGSVVRILKGVKERETDILIGTQMIAKGHDFPGITLVGIICADQSLNFPDFRACERTFQLLAQVAGRAGRGDTPGQVIMQTYNPDHFSILAAEKQDFFSFYQQEIQFRESLDYPPFSRMIQIRISGKNRQEVRNCAADIGRFLFRHMEDHQPLYDSVGILGPIEAPIPKMADRYRWQILIKSRDPRHLHRLTRILVTEFHPGKKEGIRISTDIDPYYLM
jgi:primosomal protein N' (replication factor Y)